MKEQGLAIFGCSQRKKWEGNETWIEIRETYPSSKIKHDRVYERLKWIILPFNESVRVKSE